MAPIEHVAQREAVKPEEVAQALRRRLVAFDQVDPDEAVRSCQQALDIGPAMLLHGRGRHPANLGGTAVDRLNRAGLGSLHGHGAASIRPCVTDPGSGATYTRWYGFQEGLDLAEVEVAKKGRAAKDTTVLKPSATDVSDGDTATTPARLRNKAYL